MKTQSDPPGCLVFFVTVFFIFCLLYPYCSSAAGVEGTPQAVQSAIDSASSGATITINSGSYNWGSGVTVKKYVKISGSGVTINSQTGSAMFVIAPQSAGSIELSGFTFNGASGLGAYLICQDVSGKPVLIHDCNFNAAGFGKGCVLWERNGGVIWKCVFTSTDKSDNSAIQFKQDHSESAWREPDFTGTLDSDGTHNTYVEDCTFKYEYLQAMDFDGNSRTVVRYNTFDNSAVTSHGQDTGPVGGRQVEIYNNNFIFTPGTSNNPPAGTFPLPMDYTIYIRQGGPMVITGNTIPDMNTSAWGNKAELKIALFNIRRPAQIPCQKTYPASRQIGWGISSSGAFVIDPVYIWNNTGGGNYDSPGIADWEPDQCGNGLHTSDFVKPGREYYLKTAKPGWSAYSYPHPLRGGGAPTPTPTSTPQPTPSPTPTPQPTATPTPSSTPSPTPTPPIPTPTPSPSVSYSQWWDQMADWIKAHPPTPNK